jgi:outer membrane murein-binding lipoprotein Lpp
MTMSDRDKKILMVIAPLIVVLAYWFMLFSPKREEASTAAAELETVQAQLSEAEAQATTVRAAKTNFARDYAAVVALGKAIPTSVDMPSLLVQLEQASHGTGIKLAGVTMGARAPMTSAPGGVALGAPDPAGAQPTAPSGQPPQSAPGAAAASAQGAADAASTPPPTADPVGSAPGAATGTPPAGPASGGPLESVSMEFAFEGSFFALADFFHRLKRFVYVDGERVRVRGRLMTIDSVKYEATPDTFPALTATVTATVFLSPKAEGATAGATPAGPEAAAAAPVPTSTASTAPSSPTPTATATP